MSYGRPSAPTTAASLDRRGAKRHQGRNPPAIRLVGRAVVVDEGALLEADGDEDVGGGGDGEAQVREGHHRRRPERDQPAGVGAVVQWYVTHRFRTGRPSAAPSHSWESASRSRPG